MTLTAEEQQNKGPVVTSTNVHSVIRPACFSERSGQPESHPIVIISVIVVIVPSADCKPLALISCLVFLQRAIERTSPTDHRSSNQTITPVNHGLYADFVYLSPCSPMTFTWEGGCALARDPAFRKFTVTRAQYEEYGHSICADKFDI